MKRTVSVKDIEKLRNLSDSLKGTSEYMRYYMMLEFKSGKRWVFSGWYVPQKQHEMIVKKVKNNIYLIDGDERYTLTKAVNDVLQIVEDFSEVA